MSEKRRTFSYTKDVAVRVYNNIKFDKWVKGTEQQRGFEVQLSHSIESPIVHVNPWNKIVQKIGFSAKNEIQQQQE